jgi:hypothetical protein
VRAVAALAVAVGLALLVALPTGPAPLPGEAAAAECNWQRQTKRVVKQVRRHGRLRKVVRKRHRWVCVPQAPVPALAPPMVAPPPLTPPPPAPAPEPEAEPEPEANRLAVKSKEYFYVLSRPAVAAGAVTIELNNQGEDPHNLNLRRQGEEGESLEIPETGSLQRNVADFELQPGTYRLWCSLPQHEERGMYSSLQVE